MNITNVLSNLLVIVLMVDSLVTTCHHNQCILTNRHSHVSGNPALHCTHNKRIFPLILTTPTKQLLNFHSTIFMKPETISSYRHSAVQCPQHLEFVNIFFNESQITLLVPASHWSQSIHELFSHSRELGSIFGVVSLFIILVSVWHHILWMEVGEDWWGLVGVACGAELSVRPGLETLEKLHQWVVHLTSHYPDHTDSPSIVSVYSGHQLSPLHWDSLCWHHCSPHPGHAHHLITTLHTPLTTASLFFNNKHITPITGAEPGSMIAVDKTSRWYKTDIRYLAVETIKKDWAESI